MAYTKQNFTSGSVLYASQLNAMDTQIASNETTIAGKAASADVETLGTNLAALTGSVTALQRSSSGRPMIYCYGDSLTEGVGGYVMQPDNANAYMDYSYPAWVGQVYDVVNMGARGEDIPTIMARQGADPMVITASNLTIPADLTPLKIGEATHLYTASQTGIATKFGRVAVPLREVEAAGINPVTIAGVEGIIYRTMASSAPASDGSYDYYFRRLKAGEATAIPQNTEIQTYAMRNYRNGIAIFWMGANGGASSAQDFINKVNDMIVYGQYINYLIIISREWSGADLTAIQAAFTDEGENGAPGFCHVISLMDQLPYRGYGMAGIPYQPVDTSQWTTTDPIKKNAPVLCEYLSGQSGENLYGALHYSAWGYKAIGKLVIEKLGDMGLVSGGNGGASGNPTTGDDEYGHFVYKLASPKTLTGTNYINTKIKLYDDVTKSWTFAIKWSGTPTCSSGYPANIFCDSLDGVWKGILYRYYSAGGANLLVGSGAFNVNGENNMNDHWEETNVCVIVKDGNDYYVYMNSENLATGGKLTYALTQSDAINLPLIIGARYNQEGTEIQYKTAFTVEDCRVYNEAIDPSDALSLYQELAGE